MKKYNCFGLLFAAVAVHCVINVTDSAPKRQVSKTSVYASMYSEATLSTCISCNVGVALLQTLVKMGYSRDHFGTSVKSMCRTWGWFESHVCEAYVDAYLEEVFEVLSSLQLTATEVCSIIFGERCGHVSSPLYNWILPLPPLPALSSRLTRGLSGKCSKGHFEVLHLSDTHIDLKYEEGGDAVCGEVLCCRKPTRVVPQHEKSGYWGDYRDCDLPLHTFEAILSHVRQKQLADIEYVIWTGDVAARDIFETKEGMKHILRNVTKTMYSHLNSTKIYPALGNHEGCPSDSFPPPNVTEHQSIAWLYNELRDLWSHWLPTESHETIERGGYFSVEAMSGLKLISLNMNYCNRFNFWLLLNTKDPADELIWLINQLQESEAKGEKVHIIGHIPPGSNDCLRVWSQNYNLIVNRFKDTIVGQFFGHTHNDEFELFYEREANKGHPSAVDLLPTNVAYITPSLSPYTDLNPGYRIYTIDCHTFKVIDHKTYFVNLTEANLHGKTKDLNIHLSYSARDAYGMRSLEPIDWHNLIMSMKSDDQLFQRFFHHFYNRSDRLKFKRCQSYECKKEILCRLVSSESRDTSLCDKLLVNPNPSKGFFSFFG